MEQTHNGIEMIVLNVLSVNEGTEKFFHAKYQWKEKYENDYLKNKRNDKRWNEIGI